MRWHVLLPVLVVILGFTSHTNLSLAEMAPPEPVMRLERISFPSRVLASQEFLVNVSVTYSCRQRTMTNIGLYDYGSERIIHAITFYVEGNGSRSFPFRIRAPAEESELRFEALLRYSYLVKWVYEKEALHKSFSVKVADKLRLSVTLATPNLVVKVDDQEIKTDNLGIARADVGYGEHRIEVPLKVALANNTRLSFLRWNDGSRSNPLVTEIHADTTLTAEYETEYYLTVRSNLGESYGEGWYPSGYTATFSVPRSIQGLIAHGIVPERYEFKGWSRDSDAATPTAQTRMSGPKIVEATWQVDRSAGNLIVIAAIIMMIDIVILAFAALRRRPTRG